MLNEILAPDNIPDWRPDIGPGDSFTEPESVTILSPVPDVPPVLSAEITALELTRPLIDMAPGAINISQLHDPETAEPQIIGAALIKLKALHNLLEITNQSLQDRPNSLAVFRLLLAKALMEGAALIQGLIKKRKDKGTETKAPVDSKRARALLYLAFQQMVRELTLVPDPLGVDSEIILKAARLEQLALEAQEAYQELLEAGADQWTVLHAAYGLSFAVNQAKAALVELCSLALSRGEDISQIITRTENILDVADKIGV